MELVYNRTYDGHGLLESGKKCLDRLLTKYLLVLLKFQLSELKILVKERQQKKSKESRRRSSTPSKTTQLLLAHLILGQNIHPDERGDISARPPRGVVEQLLCNTSGRYNGRYVDI